MLIALALQLLASPPLVVHELPQEAPVGVQADVSALSLCIAPGSRFVIVVGEDGHLRRVNVDTGAVTATSAEHANQIFVSPYPAGEDVWVWSPGKVTAHDGKTLEPGLRIQWEAGPERWPWISKSGNSLVLPTAKQEFHLVRVSDKEKSDDPPRITVTFGDRISHAAFSADESKALVVGADSAHVYEVTTGRELRSIKRPSDVPWTRGAFVGVNGLALSTGGEREMTSPRIEVFDIGTGERTIDMGFEALMPFGGSVRFMEVHPDLGLLVASASSAGVVGAWDLETGDLRWEIDFGGGNPSALLVRRSVGGDRALISGMTSNHARAIDLPTGKTLKVELGQDLSTLHGLENPRVTLGIKKGALVRF